MKQIQSPRFIVLSLLVVAAAFTRILPLSIPHIWNFTAVGALAIFAGSQIKNRNLAFIMPLAAMAVSDIFIGRGFSMLVYVGFIAMVGCGFLIRKRVNTLNVVLASFISAFVFYLITNIPFFYPGMYTPDLAGFITSYTAALPFFRNMLVGNLVYSAVLFGSFQLLTRYFPALTKA